MIIKIQQPPITTGKPQMLMYNEDRSFMFQSDLSKDIRNLLNGRNKAYFEAEMAGTELNMLDEVEAQGW